MTADCELTLLASLDLLYREQVLTEVEFSFPTTAVLRYDLDRLETEHVIERRITQNGRTDSTLILADEDCCLTCLLRGDILGVRTQASFEQLIAVIPAALDPVLFLDLLTNPDADAACHIVGPKQRRHPRFISIVNAQTLEQGLTDTHPPHTVATEGLTSELSTAELLCSHVEYAGCVLHTAETKREQMLISSLANQATQIELSADPARWPFNPTASVQTTRHPAIHLPPTAPVSFGGLSHWIWSRRRPVHPERFFDAFENSALGRALRVEGNLWFACRPDDVAEISIIAGQCRVAVVAQWQDAELPRYDLAGDLLPVARNFTDNWHPYYGDRQQHLNIVCDADDLTEVMNVLHGCLLTDEELSEGRHVWSAYVDPFVLPSDGFGDDDR